MKILEKIMSYRISMRDFIDRKKIIPILGLNPDSKILLLNETMTQRTYLIKSEFEFFIVNDNRGRLRIALRRSIEYYDKYGIETTDKHFLMKLIGIKPSVKISKVLFLGNIDVLIEKINTL